MNKIMSYLLNYRGKLRYQDFTSSGTFTPSSGLLANGGVCLIIIAGGGGSGAARGNLIGFSGADGGDAGRLVMQIVTVTGAVTVTIGAGGAAMTSVGNGNSGSSSTFGVITAPGGAGGTNYSSGERYKSKGGDGQVRGSFQPYQAGNQALTCRGGTGWNGKCGGGGGTSDYLLSSIHGQGADSGTDAAYNTSVTDASPNTGAGGGGSTGIPIKSGAGGSGFCRVIWFE